MTQSMMRKATLLSACQLLLLAAAGAADDQLDLVSILPGAPALTDAVTAASLVSVDHALLSDRVDGFRIQLPDGPVELVVRDGFERRGMQDLTWTGFIRFEPESRVVLTLKNGYVSGYIRSRLGLYELRPHRDGGQILQKMDTGRLPECGGSREVSSADSEDAPVTHRPLANDPANQIQLMTLYTPQARDAVGGTAQIQSLIQAAIDASNTAFGDSAMQARFVLAYAGLASYNDSGDMDADLGWVTADGGVAALRDQYGADMVSLVVDTGAYCGVAWVMRRPGTSFESSAFQVTHQLCAVGNLSFAHEHGHNLGFEHDPANGTRSRKASYRWSFGHYVNGSFRTVMSYSNACNLGCERVGQFSNPDILYNGYATGIADKRDNARTGDSTASIVASFRSSSTCGNGVCESGESSCSCDLDCGAPPTTEFLMCSDGEDNDCDAQLDCSDSDCWSDPVCGISSCEPAGAACTSNADCCDNRCRGKKGARTCRAL